MKYDHDFGTRKHEPKEWDRYRAFHTNNGPFVEFETGELMVTSPNPSPVARKVYPEYNIQLVGTTDSDCPQLYFDKKCTEPVTNAWLNQGGMQYLAIDLERKTAVSLSYWNSSRPTNALGRHVSSAKAYWAGEKVDPIPLRVIDVERPDLKFRNKMKALMSEVEAAISAIWRMKEHTRGWYQQRPTLVKREWLDSSASDIVAELSESETDMYNIVRSGFTFPRALETVDYLYIK